MFLSVVDGSEPETENAGRLLAERDENEDQQNGRQRYAIDMGTQCGYDQGDGGKRD